MPTTHKYLHILFIGAEIASFFIFFIFLVITIITGLQYEIYDIVDFLATPQFLTTLVSGLIFLLLPFITVYLQRQIENVDKVIREKRFEKEILSLFQRKTQLNIINTCAKYDLEEPFVRRVLEKKLEQGELAGKIQKGTFYLKEDFEVLPEKERRVRVLERNLLKFIQPYKFVTIAKIGKNFKVPIPVVEEVAKRLIQEHKIHGFIDGDILVRDASALALDLANLPQCPFCEARVLENSVYCSACGKHIEDQLDIVDEEEIGEDFLKDLRKDSRK